jgi:C1A family cysteine protease
VLKKHQGELKFFDVDSKEYVDIPYYDIRAPFINIKDSFGDVIFTAKSPDFYTHSEIKLDYDWISSGTYKIEWTLDIDADGDLSAENTFRVR